MKTIATLVASVIAATFVMGCFPAPRPDDDHVVINNFGGVRPCTKDADCAPGVCNERSGMCEGKDGTSCKVTMANGCAVIDCGSSKSDPICNGRDGQNGQDGVGCTVVPGANGCWVVTCGAISSAPICSGRDGQNGASCTVNSGANGCWVVTCGAISSAPICSGRDGQNGRDGQDGTSCSPTMDGNNCVVVTCGTAVSQPICDGKDAPSGPACRSHNDCWDGDPCTLDVCDMQTHTCHRFAVCGPVESECHSDADCADGNVCNGAETCVSGVCVAGAALNCNDGDPCTVDTCDVETGCAHAPKVCAPGLVCDGVTGECVPLPQATCFGAVAYYNAADIAMAAYCLGWGKKQPDGTTPSRPLVPSTAVEGGIGVCTPMCYKADGTSIAPSACSGVWYQGGHRTERWRTPKGCCRLPDHPLPEPDQAGCTWDHARVPVPASFPVDYDRCDRWCS